MAQMAEKKSLLPNPGLHDCVNVEGICRSGYIKDLEMGRLIWVGWVGLRCKRTRVLTGWMKAEGQSQKEIQRCCAADFHNGGRGQEPRDAAASGSRNTSGG